MRPPPPRATPTNTRFSHVRRRLRACRKLFQANLEVASASSEDDDYEAPSYAPPDIECLDLFARVCAFYSDAGRSVADFKANSFQRREAHLMGEALGLEHESHGEGRDRAIRMTKPDDLEADPLIAEHKLEEVGGRFRFFHFVWVVCVCVCVCRVCRVCVSCVSCVCVCVCVVCVVWGGG